MNYNALVLDNTLAMPGATLLASCLFAKLIASFVRQKIRPYVLRKVHEQCEGVAQLQHRFRNPVLDAVTKLTALTVSVEFYLISLPPVVWLCGPAGPLASMAIVQCMAVSTYMTCVLKDLLSCPRPGQTFQTGKADKDKSSLFPGAGGCGSVGTGAPAQPAAAGAGVTVGVEVLDDAVAMGEIEMGAPSMHTWCAFVMPAYSAIVAQQLGVISAARAGVLIASAACWACWVAVSRLYLGMHTPVDLVLGAVGGASMLGVWRSIGLAQLAAVGPQLAVASVQGMDHVPAWGSRAAAVLEASAGAASAQDGAASGSGSGVLGLGLSPLLVFGCMYVLALATYPCPMSYTTSYDYAVIFLGAAYGGMVGANSGLSVLSPLLRRLLGPSPEAAAAAVAAAVPWPLRHPVAVLLLGFLAVAVVKEVSKAVLCALLPRLLGLAPLELRRLWQPPVHPAGCWRPRLEAGGSGGLPDCPSPGLQEEEDLAGVGAECVGAVKAAAVHGPTPGNPVVHGIATIQPPANGLELDRVEGRKGWTGRNGYGGLLMRTPRLPYDVDFVRKFVNYGITVYSVMEYRHVAALLLGGPP